VLSMVIASFLIRYNAALVQRIVAPSDAASREVLAHDVAAQPVHHSGHVLIVGFGRVGQNVARLLEQEGFDWVALDLDPLRIRLARAAGDPVYFGDATSADVLRAAGIERARVLFISYYRVSVALKILAQVHKLRPDIPVLVRVRDDSSLDELMAAGATEVIPDTLEASLMVASHLLVLLTVPMTRVVRAINAVRNDRYALLRNVFRGQDARPIDASHAFREQLASVQLDDSARAAGRALGELELEGVVVTALRRDGIVGRQPGPETRLRAGDVVVLYGKPEDLERAEEQLLGG
jgi:monovalent cation:H+ antiporter-2, CPA2 family